MPAPILPFPVLQFEATFTEEAGSTTAPFLYQSLLRCSYDPNDKAVHPARTELENKTRFSEELLYTIRFQNNGNDTAFAVTIVDVLDENILTNSIRVRSSSHPVRTQIQEQTLTFTFPGIALVDSITNYEGSQGFVTFSCETADGLDENTLVTNTADIIFDMNPPIVTNTVENLLVSMICDEEIKTEESRTICEGETYAGYNTSGIYTNFLTNFEGCDSLHVIELTVIDRREESIEIELCPDETALVNGTIYSEAGSYLDTVLHSTGCIDILYEIEVTILPADDPQCAVATVESEKASITLYPNPAKDYVRIHSDLPIRKIGLLSAEGSSVSTPAGVYTNEYIELSTQGLPAGVYILSLTTDTGQLFRKLIKE